VAPRVPVGSMGGMWISTTQHRTRPALAGLVGATVLATGLLPTRAAHAAAKPPVVKIVLHGNNAKITGAKGLKAGWLTLRLSATDAGYHDLYLGSARNGDPGPGGKAGGRPAGHPEELRQGADERSEPKPGSHLRQECRSGPHERTQRACRWVGSG